MEVYDSKVITKQKIKILLKTNLIDLIEDEYARFPEDDEMKQQFSQQQSHLESRRTEVFHKIDNESEIVKSVSTFFANTEQIENLKSSALLTMEHLNSLGITSEALEAYYQYSKFKYESGMYNDAEEMLGNFLSVSQPLSTSLTGARWGRLACHILGAKWELAATDLASIKDSIDIRNVTAPDQLRQRAWLLHWSLFVNINHREGPETLVELFSERNYLVTIENLCPWLLRYYAAFVVLSPARRRVILKDVIQEIQNMSYSYSDPITEFLTLLYVDFDFTGAQKKLTLCQSVLKQDFLLQIYTDKFMYEARMLICELYCSVNSRVDLVMMAEQLQLTVEETEKWMVDMVVNTGAGTPIDAKIDSAAKQAIIAPPSRAVYQDVVDKARDLTNRTSVLSGNLASLMHDQGQFVKAKLAV